MQEWMYKHRYIAAIVIVAAYVAFGICLVGMFMSLGG